MHLCQQLMYQQQDCSQSPLPRPGVCDCEMHTHIPPREFITVMLTAVYIPPDVNASSALDIYMTLSEVNRACIHRLFTSLQGVLSHGFKNDISEISPEHYVHHYGSNHIGQAAYQCQRQLQVQTTITPGPV